ncbi:PLP-dependent transferase [Lapillicoccus sp.]|uniref:trans-sulfuration enzyme family protein n=1 Tax=Lapillicoccus sp. TaxID=1909287 RepID=UPI0025FC95C2|nr:PLP-dependent transferase [Lapillicoccus sp.]
MSDLDDLSPASVVVAAGRPPRRPGASVNPPVEFTSTYAAPEAGVAYGRNGNAVWDAFEEALGHLEGGHARVFASGMAAISATLALVPAGGTVVTPRHAYNLTNVLLEDYREAGYEVRQVDISNTAEVVAAVEGADMVWTESPTNPMLEVADLRTIFAAAREHGALGVCDNTLSTPLLQQPLALGADVVVHSVTKYLAGHSDVVLGATVTGDHGRGPELLERLTRHRTMHGAIGGPMEVWLALRGLRTLQVRFERSCANAVELARRLEAHPGVERVRYPGTGAMVSIEVAGDAAAADAVAAGCRLWLDATSLGGVESLIERRRKYAAEAPTVPEQQLRLSVGIEDVEDLWTDLDRALRAALPG